MKHAVISTSVIMHVLGDMTLDGKTKKGYNLEKYPFEKC